MRWRIPAVFPPGGGARRDRPHAVVADEGRSGCREEVAEVSHHGLPDRRPRPPGHLRPQAERPGRSRGASSSRSTRTCPASSSANCCRSSRDAPTRSSCCARSSASGTSTARGMSYTGTTMDVAKREKKPHFGSRRRPHPGADRPGGAGVRRPVADDAAQAVQHARPGDARPRRGAGEGRWRRSRCAEEARRADGAARGPASRCSRRWTATQGSGATTRSTTARSKCSLPAKVVDALDVSKESPSGPRALRQGLAQAPRRRRPDVERPTADGPPPRRGRQPRRHRRLRLLGHARQQLQVPEAAPATLRHGHLGADRGHLRPRPGQGRDGRASGASSAARRRSTRTPAATTGRA